MTTCDMVEMYRNFGKTRVNFDKTTRRHTHNKTVIFIRTSVRTSNTLQNKKNGQFIFY